MKNRMERERRRRFARRAVWESNPQKRQTTASPERTRKQWTKGVQNGHSKRLRLRRSKRLGQSTFQVWARVRDAPERADLRVWIVIKKIDQKLYSTCASPVVPHPSTGHAHGCLASEIGRDPAFPTRFDRTVDSPEVSLLAPSTTSPYSLEETVERMI